MSQDANPLVSCIVPVYNGEAYLREAIDSLIAQAYPHVEIVVVDDGSTDGTAGVISGYGGRVRVLSQDNRGVSVARNRGVEMSSGQLLSFLDADDRLDHLKIVTQVAAFGADPRLEFCACHSSYFWTSEMSVEALERDFRHAELYWRKPVMNHISTWLFRRELWERVGGFAAGLRYAEDVDWLSRARDLPARLLMLPDVLTHLRIHPNNVTRTRSTDQTTALADTFMAHLRRTRNHALKGASHEEQRRAST
jgi:glycosyltransferase involved in cell wall biosynthesis